MSKYDDIIDAPRPEMQHARQPREARAAQFAPFAALVGFYERVLEADREKMQKMAAEEAVEVDIDAQLEAPEDEAAEGWQDEVFEAPTDEIFEAQEFPDDFGAGL